MNWVYDDGGRQAAGFKGTAGDCVVRSITIAIGAHYQQVYDELFECNKQYAWSCRDQYALMLRKIGCSPRDGVYRWVYEPYLKTKGWLWTPTMFVGGGCKVHLRSDELPSGNLVCTLSKHMCAVIDGVVHDCYDPSRAGSRCVYGYFSSSLNPLNGTLKA